MNTTAKEIGAVLKRRLDAYEGKPDVYEYGTVTSSFIIQKWGCQTNAPTWEQVEERYGVYKKQGEGDCNESY